MQCQSYSDVRPKLRSSSRILARRIPVSSIFLLLLSQLCCVEKGAPPKKMLDPKYMNQMHSLSLAGPQLAALILDRTRELRLTIDGGQTWRPSQHPQLVMALNAQRFS